MNGFLAAAIKLYSNAIALAGIKLPDGQATHVLRHSFASHYMINGGDFLRLNKELGHKTIQMTQRYAYLAPSHLIDIAEKKPFDLTDALLVQGVEVERMPSIKSKPATFPAT